MHGLNKTNPSSSTTSPPDLSKQSSNEPHHPKSTSNNNHKQSNLMRERFLHFQISSLAPRRRIAIDWWLHITVQGVLHAFTPFDHPSLPLEHRNRYVIKDARVSKGKGDGEKEIDTGGGGGGKRIIVEAEKVSQLIVKSIRLEQNSNPQARRSQMAMVPQMDTQM